MSQADDFCKELNAAIKLDRAAYEMAILRVLNRYGAAQVDRMPGLYVMADGSRAQFTGPARRVAGQRAFEVVTP